MLEAQAPAKQTATDTIHTLSGRLNNATLLEDRRAAILGLRSFAKEYPASVASGALRGLIGSLTKDGDDVDTIKVVLETLLMLFSPDERSPEASDDIALWLADEFTQRQDNITILLDLLETPDFYSRLYSLQLITAICSARPERTQECILSAPLGTTRLVALLDDPRDAVRNAGLLLCTDLTVSSVELQKLVAFESAFDRVFRLIESEGSLLQGGIIVQDCLSLLANLIRGNASNQSLFRETGCVKRVLEILPGGSKDGTPRDGDDDGNFENPQSGKNIWGLLAVIRMFFVQGSVSSRPNSETFQKNGFLQRALDLSFSTRWEGPIRAEALYTCSDMIRGNAKLQEGFAQLQVNPGTEGNAAGNGKPQTNGVSKVYVIDALLDLTLRPSPPDLYNCRFAACECLKAYAHGHAAIRLHFLHRAVDGHTSGEDETANVLTSLIHGPPGSWSSNPYGSWFAAVLVLHLISDDAEAKKLLMDVAEGDAENGEEVVTCIQAITGNLIDCLQREQDQRISIAYLMLLSIWLFDDNDAVSDFLGEGSSLQSLVQAASRTTDDDHVVVRGLCASLLGIIYEFSTKDSPISRRTLQPILTSRLGRDSYIDALKQLRRHPLIRDFELSPQGSSSLAVSASLPPIYFDPTFMDFLKDNFSRLIRAIDRDPGIEIHASSTTSTGVDRDALDELRTELAGRIEALQKAEADILSLESKLNQAHAEHKRAQETSMAEVARIKNINDALQKGHEIEIDKIQQGHRASTEYLQDQHAKDLDALHQQLTQAEAYNQAQLARLQGDADRWKAAHADVQRERDDARAELGRARADAAAARAERDTAQRTADAARQSAGDQQRQLARLPELEQERQRLAAELGSAKSQISELQSAAQEWDAGRAETETKLQEADRRVEEVQGQLGERDRSLTGANQRVREVEGRLEEKEEARAAAQGELDEMLMVMTDLEEKRVRDKKRLKALGEEVSDMEDEDEDEDEDQEEDQDGEGEEEEGEDDEEGGEEDEKSGEKDGDVD
ncbi:MAG: hypothetical protein M1822_009092 [Bathelium mastoideum]|nr:MAG: hypothetical protein M1822_009092 [Bathelium mastoideum]